jgi:uncharacterized membrane protein
MLGMIYAVLAAASFGFNSASVRRGTITGTVAQIVALSMPLGLVTFAAVALAAGQIDGLGQLSRHAYLLLASAGVLHFVFGRYCNYRSIQAMGANLSAPITQWNLLVSLTLAIAFLGERLDLLKLVGIVLMVAAPAMVYGTQKVRGLARPAAAPARPVGAAVAPRPEFQPRLVEGYVFGVLSCLCYGASPALVRAGLEGSELALAGGVVSYAAATLIIALMLLLPGARRDIAAIDRRNLLWFVITGITVCISQIFFYLAIALAPVTVVIPLMRVTTLFSTLFSWLFNRAYESFELGLLAAIAISIVGALALTLDSAVVAHWLDAPPWLAAALAWKWPA